ncbi:MAG: hypothetical protein E7I48_17430 [Clostridium celatum]|nr:hypothetical protein [Clostridium celatum]
MNKTVKFLLEADGLLLATKLISGAVSTNFLGILMPQYFVASVTLGLLASGYYQAKTIYNKKKEDKEISENDLFKLED